MVIRFYAMISFPDGRKFRLLNVIDDYRREGLTIGRQGSHCPQSGVIRTLNQLLEWRETVSDPMR